MENRIGQAIRSKRHILGYSQEELAELVDRTPSHIGQIERGDTLPSVDTLMRLMDILSINAGEIFSAPSIPNDLQDIMVMFSKLNPQIQHFIADIIRMAYKTETKKD